MYVKNILFVFFLVIALTGFYSVVSVQALDYADWPGTWFRVKVSETGKAGPVVTEIDPDGGQVVKNNQKTTDSYLKILLFQPDGYFEVGYCTFDGSVWETQHFRYPTDSVRLIWPIVGGEPTRFLTFFNIKRSQSQNVTEEYWVPIEVYGTESKEDVGKIDKASFKHLGGIFYEEIGTPAVTQRGIGSMKFQGEHIKVTDVEKEVPEGCRLTAPAP